MRSYSPVSCQVYQCTLCNNFFSNLSSILINHHPDWSGSLDRNICSSRSSRHTIITRRIIFSNSLRAMQVVLPSRRRRCTGANNTEARNRSTLGVLECVPPCVDTGPKSVAPDGVVVGLRVINGRNSLTGCWAGYRFVSMAFSWRENSIIQTYL